jgi:predicted RNA binding protein YcfA (HicA-like mRNA interferase family)
MKLPRDVAGVELANALARIGYRVSRESGIHIRLTTDLPAQHHVTIPAHDPLKLGTLAAILGEVAAHPDISREALVERLFRAPASRRILARLRWQATVSQQGIGANRPRHHHAVARGREFAGLGVDAEAAPTSCPGSRRDRRI